MTHLEVGQRVVREVDTPGQIGPKPNIRVLTIDAPAVVSIKEGREAGNTLRLLLEAHTPGYASYRIEFQTPTGEYIASGGEQFRVFPARPEPAKAAKSKKARKGKPPPWR